MLVASNELDPSVKKALGELAARRQALGRQNAELDKLKEQRRQLVEDEKRLRDNLNAVYRPGLSSRSRSHASVVYSHAIACRLFTLR